MEEIIGKSWAEALNKEELEILKVKWDEIQERRKLIEGEVLPLENNNSGIYYAL